jgi:hypothetical protein
MSCSPTRSAGLSHWELSELYSSATVERMMKIHRPAITHPRDRPRDEKSRLKLPQSTHVPTMDAYLAEVTADAPAANVSAQSDKGAITLTPFWQFRFFQKDGLRTALAALVSKDSVAIDKIDPSIRKRCAAFITAVEATVKSLDSHSLIAAIRNKEQRTALRAAYEPIAKLHNDVSLCLWHGPIAIPTDESILQCYGQPAAHWNPNLFHRSTRRYEVHRSAGTMLTGDINLTSKLRPSFTKHYRNHLQTTAVFQLPHHGSSRSWEHHYELLASRPIMVASCGIGNQYGHPHASVVDDLEEEFGLPVYVSNERNAVRYKIEMEYG